MVSIGGIRTTGTLSGPIPRFSRHHQTSRPCTRTLSRLPTISRAQTATGDEPILASCHLSSTLAASSFFVFPIPVRCLSFLSSLIPTALAPWALSRDSSALLSLQILPLLSLRTTIRNFGLGRMSRLQRRPSTFDLIVITVTIVLTGSGMHTATRL